MVFCVFTVERSIYVHDFAPDIHFELWSRLESTDVSKRYTHQCANTTAVLHDLWVDRPWRSTRFASITRFFNKMKADSINFNLLNLDAHFVQVEC